MTKTKRKILLSIALFLALVCFAIGLNVGLMPKTANAEGSLQVTSIRETDVVASYWAGSWRKNDYAIVFNQDVFTNDVANGTVIVSNHSNNKITNAVSITIGGKSFNAIAAVAENSNVATAVEFISNVTVNGDKIYTAQDGCAVIKLANNALKVVVGRACGYAEIVIPANLTLNGATFAETTTYYKRSDDTFATTKEGFKVIDVIESGQDTGTSVLCVSTTMHNQVAANSYFQYISINGTPIADSEGNPATGVTFGLGTDWDACNGYLVRFTVQKTMLTNGATITINPGFTIDGQTALQTAQTFYLESGNGGRDSDGRMRVAVESTNVLDITSIEQDVACDDSTNTIFGLESQWIFTFNKNILNDVAVGEDVTAQLFRYGNFFENIYINGKSLHSTFYNKFDKWYNDIGTTSGYGNDMKAKKESANSIRLIQNTDCVTYCSFEIKLGLNIDGLITTSASAYYQDNILHKDAEGNVVKATFTKGTTAPALKVADVFMIPKDGVAHIQVAFTQSVSKPANLDGMLINGKQIEATTYSIANDTIYNNTLLRIEVADEAFDLTKSTITLPNGFCGITAQQEFITSTNDFGLSPDNKWVEVSELFAQTINYKQGDNVIKTESDTKAVLPVPSDITGYTAGKIFFGWTDGEKLYKAGETIWGLTSAVDFKVVELDAKTIGMSLKMYGEDGGARFETKINLAEYTEIAKFLGKYGTLIARADDLAGNELTVESAQADSKVKMIESTQCVVKEDYVHFFGGVNAMPESNYTKTIVGRAYIEVNYANGVDYVYSEAIERVMADVANEILDGQLYADEDLDWLNKYAGINA